MPSAKKTTKKTAAPSTAAAPTTATPKTGSSKGLADPSIWDSHPMLFHALAALPPTITCLYVIPPEAFVGWLFAWNCLRMLLQSHGSAARAFGGHLLTVWASYRSVDSKGWDLTQHLAAALGTGLIMGVAYKNLMNAGLWLTSGFPERPVTSSAISAGGIKGVDESRPAVVVPLQHANGGKGAPANVHGRKVFTVKVALPLNKSLGKAPAGSFDGLGMVSDAAKSFQAFVDLEAEGAGTAALTRLIATKGAGGGIKGYFEAQRQGDDLRIYVDAILPAADW